MKLWIRIDVAIATDPNVITLSERLAIPFAEAVGLCTLLWCQIAEHRPTGDISGLSVSTLEKWAGFSPRKGKGAGSFGALFLELFASEGMASGWRKRQGALIEHMARDRNRKTPRVSTENPRKFQGNSTATKQDSTEQITKEPRFLKPLIEAMNDELSHRFTDYHAVRADQFSSIEYAEKIETAGVPLEAAERLLRKACRFFNPSKHGRGEYPGSLKYFAQSIIDDWKRDPKPLLEIIPPVVKGASA